MWHKGIAYFTKAADRISYAGGLASALAVFLILVLVNVEVFGRSLFNVSTMIADEMSGYLNAAMIFLGLAYTLKERGFIRVEVVYNRVQGPTKTFIKWVIVLASLAYAGVILVYLWKHVLYSFQFKILALSVTETPLFIPQGIVLVGVLILVVQLVAFLLNRVRSIP